MNVNVQGQESARKGREAPRAPAGRRAGGTGPNSLWAAARVAVWVLALVPLVLLARDAFLDQLGAEPIKEITHRTGWWALALLLTSLAITPLRRLSGWNQLIKFRRPLGLFGFFYATLHVLTYFGLDQFFDLPYIVEDIVERPYITVGFVAWLLLIPLAVTSTQGWIRKLGKRWQRLHRLVYVAVALGALHFLWAMKADIREPLIFAAVLALLLLLRLPVFQRRRAGRAPTRKGPTRPAETVGGRS